MFHEQLIELWETYLLQLDSDEDGPPFMPVGLQATQQDSGEQDREQDKSEAQMRREAATAQLHAENAAANGEEHEGSLSGTTVRDDDEEARVAAVHTAEAEA